MPKSYGQLKAKVFVEGQEIEGRQIVLPMPPSENARLTVDWNSIKGHFGEYYANAKKTKRGVMRNSTAYNRYKSACAHLLKKGKYPPIEGGIAVFIGLCFENNRVRDIDNRIKPLFDTLTQSGCVWNDDKQVKMFCVEMFVIPEVSFCVALVVPRAEVPQMKMTLSGEFMQSIANDVRSFDCA